MNRPVKKGDILTLLPAPFYVELIGVVLDHHDELSDAMTEQVYDFEKIKGPGVSIYWSTSDIIAYWDYKRVMGALEDKSMKIVTRLEQSDSLGDLSLSGEKNV